MSNEALGTLFMLLRESKYKILFLFIYSLFPLLFWPAIVQTTHLSFFAPFLCILFYKCSIITTLFLSMLCGMMLDLFTGNGVVEVQTLSLITSSAILYRLKTFFFEDGLTTIPILSYFYGVLHHLTLLIFLSTTHLPKLSIPQVLEHIFVFPLWNIPFTIFWFGLPIYFLRRRPGRSKETFSLS